MHEIKGDLWVELGKSVVLVTTNSTIKTNGALVMGRGAALEAKNQFPAIDIHLGELVAGRNKYGVVILQPYANGMQLGAFQSKYSYAQNSHAGLIAYSANMLWVLAMAMPWQRFAMNYPGIGNGRLHKSSVEKIIRILPDNVFVYTKD